MLLNRRKSAPAAQGQSLGDAGPKRVVQTSAGEEPEGAPHAADGAFCAGQGGGDERRERRERGRRGVHSGSLLRGQDSLGVVRGAARLGAGEIILAPFQHVRAKFTLFFIFLPTGRKVHFLGARSRRAGHRATCAAVVFERLWVSFSPFGHFSPVFLILRPTLLREGVNESHAPRSERVCEGCESVSLLF